MELSRSSIRYLLGIYELSQGTGLVRCSDLAGYVGVTKASVVKMCAGLAKSGIITKQYYGCIRLTEAGAVQANLAYTRVIIIQQLLMSQFGVSEDNAHRDAVECICTLSDECREKMIDFALKTGS